MARRYMIVEAAHQAKLAAQVAPVANPTYTAVATSNQFSALELVDDFPVGGFAAQAYMVSDGASYDTILADTAATRNICFNKAMFVQLKSIAPVKITGISGDPQFAYHVGSIIVPGFSELDHSPMDILIPDVLFVPTMVVNLLSLSQLCANGAAFSGSGTSITIVGMAGNSYFVCEKTDDERLWQCKVRLLSSESIFSASAETWHYRLGHLNYEAIKRLASAGSIKLSSRVASSSQNTCITCQKSKICRLPFTSHFPVSSNVLNPIHSDVIGPFPASLGGARYLVSFIDDCSRYATIFPIKAKSDVFDCFVKFKSQVELLFNTKIKFFHSDRGGEYQSSNFLSYLSQHGITLEQGPAETPEHNSVSERYNRSLIERVRCNLHHASLPVKLWAEIALATAFTLNQSPHSFLNHVSPLSVWNSFIPDTGLHGPDPSFLRTLGCSAIYLAPRVSGKLGLKGREGVLLGYEAGAKAYRVWDLEYKKVVITCSVLFNESIFPFTNQPLETESPKFVILQDSGYDIPDVVPGSSSLSSVPPPITRVPNVCSPITVPGLKPFLLPSLSPRSPSSSSPRRHSPITPSIAINSSSNGGSSSRVVSTSSSKGSVDRPVRTTSKPQRLGNFVGHVGTDLNDEPTYKQAMEAPDAEEWKKAMKVEFDSLVQHNVGKLVPKPLDARVIGGMWVLKKKRDENGVVLKYKARWVCFGNCQVAGVDFHDTYSAVGKADTFRLLVAVAAYLKCSVVQFDIITAFLHGIIKERVYIQQVKGFVEPGTEGMVWELGKSLYGTRQGARDFSDHLRSVLLAFGFETSKSDDCLFIYRRRSSFLYLHMHVDDGFLISDCDSLINDFKTHMLKSYQLKWKIKPTLHLGMHLTYHGDGAISLNQTHFLQDLLERFGFEDLNSVKLPFPVGLKLLHGSTEDVAAASHLPYQSLVGSLNWAAISTRPDIAFAVSQLSRFNSCYTFAHWNAAKHLACYLKGSLSVGIMFRGRMPAELKGYGDADYANDPLDRRSVTGYLFTFGDAIISWRSRRQKSTALSTTEAEYMAISDCARHALWFKSLFNDLKLSVSAVPLSSTGQAIQLFNDNRGTVLLSKEPVINDRSKHIDVRYHFIRDHVPLNNIVTAHVPTTSMPADFLTKPLPVDAFQRCCGQVHVF